jgi:hypothetical protein
MNFLVEMVVNLLAATNADPITAGKELTDAETRKNALKSLFKFVFFIVTATMAVAFLMVVISYIVSLFL